MAPAKKAGTPKTGGKCPQCGGPLGDAPEYSQASGQCAACGYQVTDPGKPEKDKPSRPL